MAVDKEKAQAAVRLVTGQHVNFFANIDQAKADADRANGEAERIGVDARYEAYSLT